MAMHADEVPIDAATVRALVAEQLPQWRALPVRRVADTGTVNAVFRLGEALSARFPLRAADPVLLQAGLVGEADAARRMAEVAPVPVPLPVALGEPGHGYPLPWSVQTWLPGTTAAEDDPGASIPFAHDLAALVAALRTAGTRGAVFTGDGRGGDLRHHDAWVADRLGRSAGLLDVRRAAALWARLRTLPRGGPDAMTHGDLIPGNLLVAGGRLTGVLDVGGFAPADPALDLVVAWHLLEPAPRAAFRSALEVGEVPWQRGRAWALEQALGLVEYYRETNPQLSALGSRTLGRVLAG